jgi:hypothetical protein
MVVAVPQAPSKVAGARGQPARNARRLGSRLVLSQPGSVANEVSTYWARSAAGFGGGHTGQGFSGSWAQPVSRISSQGSRAMWIVYLEMGLALALAVLIVWFTWPRKPK